MFSSPEPLSPAIRELFETYAGFYARALQIVLEAGDAVMEQHVDTLRTLYATTTVATRQWSNAGRDGDWMTPVLHATALFAPHPAQGGLPFTSLNMAV